MKKTFRRTGAVSIAFLLLAAIAELSLRFVFGLGAPALVQTDPGVGYYFKPDQNITRFGKRIRYNRFSQRSDPASAARPPGITRILMVGDSVLNGGNPVDQSETISELLRARLTAEGCKVEVLAASAGGWALENRLGYLRKFGLCDSNLVILEIGTNDLLQPFAPPAVVDRDENFPSRRPMLALQDAWLRYAWPLYLRPFLAQRWPSRFPAVAPPAEEQSAEKYFPRNLELIRLMVAEVRNGESECWVLYVPDQTDLSGGQPMQRHEDELFAMLAELRVPLVNLMAKWSSLPKAGVAQSFRDQMHLTAVGDRAVADVLAEPLLKKLKPDQAARSTHP